MKKILLLLIVMMMSFMVNAWKISNTFNSSMCLDPYLSAVPPDSTKKLSQSMTVSYGRSYTQNNVNLSFRVEGGLKAPNNPSKKDTINNSSPIKFNPITLVFNASW